MNVKTANRFDMQLSKMILSTISVLIITMVCVAADPVESKNKKAGNLLGKLQLIGGDVYQGEFGKSVDGNGDLIWKCPAFVSDMIVPWSVVESLVQPIPTQKPTEEGRPTHFIVELQNGESLTGNVTSIGEEFVDVESELIGQQHIPTSTVRSILRTPSMSASESGELKFADWKEVEVNGKKGKYWFDGLGSYDTETAGATISQSVTIPDLAAIDLSVAWQTARPNFTLQIGDTDQSKLEIGIQKPENRNTLSISVIVEDNMTADIATITQPFDGSSGITLRVLCDSVRGRLVVTQNGVALAQLPMSKNMKLTGKQTVLFMNNLAGRISLRSLKIYRSIFSSPVFLTKGKESENGQIKSPETLLQNGQTFVGQLIGFESKDRSFGFATSENLGRVSLDQVDRIEFPYSTVDQVKIAEQKLFSIQLWSGARFVGQSVAIKTDQLVVSLEKSKSEVRIPLADIMSIGQSGKFTSEPDDESAIPAAASMRLISPWAISRGRIVPMESATGTPAPKMDFQTLNWKPLNALFPIAIASGVTGTIEPFVRQPKASKSSKPNSTESFGRSLDKDEPSLFLKSGDCFAAEIQSVNEGEMTFQSSLFSANKIDINEVRGVRKLVYTGTDTMEKAGRKRLLTLPRSQRNNPPTHLVVSREGDAIRGQLLSLDVDSITLQVRGEERKIQMKNVAEIIWLQDAPEIVPPGKKPTSEPSMEVKVVGDMNGKGDLVCQALDSSGTRVSIAPERVEGDILYGQHPQLGDCHIDLSKISKLVLGDAIADEAKKNRFGKWKLENAADPKFVNDLDSPDAEGNAPDSVHAKMIGNAAPDFELKKLDGTLLKLSDLRGRVVVLDFWATWCGPCVASLPKITDLGQEYKGANVDVIAVNIEQTSAEVRGLLDRLKISPLVVLDSDGAVARAYQAQAIPQTVIIDREGKVKQVIVGGGGTTEAKIRESLDGMLNLKD